MGCCQSVCQYLANFLHLAREILYKVGEALGCCYRFNKRSERSETPDQIILDSVVPPLTSSFFNQPEGTFRNHSSKKCLSLTWQPFVIPEPVSPFTKSAVHHHLSCEDFTGDTSACSLKRSTSASNVGLRPDLYRKSEFSGSSSGEVGYDPTYLSFGAVMFTATYHEEEKRLAVYLEEVNDIPPIGEDHVDVVAELCIIPGRKHIRRGTHVATFQNPALNEYFNMPISCIGLKAVQISILNKDWGVKHQAVGYASLSLDGLSEKSRKFHLRLHSWTEPKELRGTVHISLTYRVADSRLSIVIMQAKELMLPGIGKKLFQTQDHYNTYVKVSLYNAGAKVASQRSRVIPDTKSPFYNASFAFILPLGTLDSSSIIVSIWLHSTLTKDQLIGQVIFGPFCYSDTGIVTPWGRAIAAREMVNAWYKLTV